MVWHSPDEDDFAKIPLTPEYFAVVKKILSMKNNFGKQFISRANRQSAPHPKVLELSKGKVRIFTDFYDRAGNLEVKCLEKKHITDERLCDQAVSLNHNILLPDGSVVLCCMDYGLTHILGNLLCDSYENVLSSKEMMYVRHKLTINDNQEFICRKCHSARPIEKHS